MQVKTSNKKFEPYGCVYDESLDDLNLGLISRSFNNIAQKYITQLYHFECEVYLEMRSGMASLLISTTPESSTMECFAIHRLIKIKPGMYFAVVAVTATASFKLATLPGYSFSRISMNPSYTFLRILPRIQIQEILGHYYSIRNSGYEFKGERHGMYELTYVDCGTLTTVVEGVKYVLKEKDLMLYGPEQFHTQQVSEGESCSYVTIIFTMNNLVRDTDEVQNRLLLNKVFTYDKTITGLIQTFIQESTSQIPYASSLMLCLLTEIMIRLLQSSYIGTAPEKPNNVQKHHYRDKLFEKIIDFINKNIYEPLTIAEICEKFSLSRSSLQLIFKEHMKQTPKKYINELKLEKSREMIRQNEYTISEIALILGFNSIHYFSRAFAQQYGMAPSEYAKQVINPEA